MRVFVGMSGGVDSSLTAALLKEQGYDVTGVYMKNWTEDLPGMRCPWADDLADAKRVAVQLGIPFKVYDFQAEYKQKVVDYMIDEYKAGRTPNPDIMCNQEVKFKIFLETALEDGADLIATGHYARIGRTASSSIVSDAPDAIGQSVLSGSAGKAESSSTEDEAVLCAAKDVKKDQTYFLYRVTGEALKKTLFPLGSYEKTEVRKMAEERGLLTASKKDSQGICFVGSVGIKDFLSEFVETSPGNVVDKESGAVVGRHDGAIFYTIGQRHGLGLGGGLPYYVVGKDMDKNEVYVSRDLNSETLWTELIPLTNTHWINQPPAEGEKLKVRLRHQGALLDATYEAGALRLHDAQRAVSSGQSAVVYQGEVCLGGGIVA